MIDRRDWMTDKGLEGEDRGEGRTLIAERRGSSEAGESAPGLRRRGAAGGGAGQERAA